MIRVQTAASVTLAVPTEKFLLEVEKRPCLWDPGHKEYRNLATRRHAFRLIATILVGENIPEEKLNDIGVSLSSKWKHIREYWFKVKSNPSNAKCQDNQYFKILKFLEPTIASEILKQQTTKASGVSSGDSNKSTPIKTNSLPKSSTTSSQDEEYTSRPSMAKRKRTSSRSSSVMATQVCTNSSKQTHRSAHEQKLSEESRSTVVIDGVEFEQVTLENGEVVVKLKEEKLEDELPRKRKEKRKKKRPAHKDGHSSESGHLAPQGCQSVDHELVEKSKDALQHGELPEDEQPSIDSAVEIEGPTVEIPWSSTEATPTKKVHIDLGTVDDLKKLAELPPKLDFHDSSDNKFQPIIRKEPIEESDPIEISDDDSSSGNLNDQNSPKDKPKDCLDRWNSKLGRLAAQSSTDADRKNSTDSLSSDDALLHLTSSRASSDSYAKLKRWTAQPGTDADGSKAKDESNNHAELRPSKSCSLATLTHRTEKPKRLVAQTVADADGSNSNGCRSSDDAQHHSSKSRSPSTTTRRTENLKRRVAQTMANADDGMSNDCRSRKDAQRHSIRSRSSSKSDKELAPEKPIDPVDEHSPKVKSPEDEDDEDNKKFLMWFLPEMRTMTETQNYEFRLEVMQALSRAKYS